MTLSSRRAPLKGPGRHNCGILSYFKDPGGAKEGISMAYLWQIERLKGSRSGPGGHIYSIFGSFRGPGRDLEDISVALATLGRH